MGQIKNIKLHIVTDIKELLPLLNHLNMAVSGVKCHKSVVDQYNEFKKSNSPVSYMLCKIEDHYIQVEEAHVRENGDKQLESICIAAQCRYGFYIFAWESPNGPRDMVVLIQYCDDNANSKMKLTYSTTTAALKRACRGVGLIVEANDRDELGYNEILEKCKLMKTR